MSKKNSVEPTGSAIASVKSRWGVGDYIVIEDVTIPALTPAEAEAWIDARNKRLRGATREALMYFLTRAKALKAGWHIGVRQSAKYSNRLIWGPVDRRGMFRGASYTCWFNYRASRTVLELAIARIREAAQ